MSKFKVKDEVICIDNSGFEGRLTLSENYKIEEVSEMTTSVKICNDLGYLVWMNSNRFIHDSKLTIAYADTGSDTIDISQPSYYNKGIETKDYIRSHDLNFNRGSAIKYVTRAGKKDKDKEIEDLKKAINFLQFEIEYLENDNCS